MKKPLAALAIAAMALSLAPIRATNAAGPNLVPNASFEDGTTSPSSWTRQNGTSRNRTVFTWLLTGAQAGTKAGRVAVTTYVAGDVGWLSASFPVTGGQTYDVSDFSRSTVSSTVLAIYQRSNGSSTTVNLGTVAGTGSWKAFTKTITVPANVTSVKLIHALRRTGTLDVDAFTFGLHTVPVVGANLVLNPDLETPNPTNGALPDHWTNGSWGTLTPVFTYPTPGLTGNGAKVVVTGYSSGDAKWVFEPIATTGGKTYSVAFDYLSTVTSNVSIEYHMTNGTFTYGWLGDPAASAAWSTFSRQLTIPAGADSFTVFAALAANGSLTVDRFVVTETTNGATAFANGMITLEFDDTYANQYTVARPKLNAANIKATFAAITDPEVGIGSDATAMTWANVVQLKNDGHEIAAHTRTHPDLTTLTAAQAQAEIAGSKADIMAHIAGYTPTTFVYPYGQFNPTIQQFVKDAGFVGARSVFDGYNFPTSDKFALLDKHIEATTTLADVQGWIAQAMANKTWLILELHEQTTTPGPDTGVYYNTPAMLDGIIAAIQSSGIAAKTIAQGVALMNP